MIELNTPEALEKLTLAGFKIGDFVEVSNTVDNDPAGFLCKGRNGYEHNVEPQVIFGYLQHIFNITNYFIYNDRLYVGENTTHFVLIESCTKPFKFASTLVKFSFETKQILTHQGNETFENVFKLYGCMLALNKDCETRYNYQYKLHLENYDSKVGITDDTQIIFGCQKGTFAEVKAIVEYIKQNQK